MFLILRAVTYATLFIGFVLVALPARLAGWSSLQYPVTFSWSQLIGAACVAAGATITLWCIATFVLVGRGTPAPFDPPRLLVDRGPYVIVRNPMYCGAVLAMTGAAMFYQSWGLAAYGAVFLAATHLFVISYEEPTLRNNFGTAYDDYCRRVGRWCPTV